MSISDRISSPSERGWTENWSLIAILVAYLILGLVYSLVYSLVVPAYEAPDEPAHLAYTWHLWQTGERLPATDAAGNRLPGDTTILERVRVTREEHP